MKVLKKGREQKGWTTKATCTGNGNGDGGCGAELLVEQGDLYQTSSSALGETTDYITFTCAACGVETDLADTDGTRSRVPAHVWDKAPTKKNHPLYASGQE